jgi:hypothetical protein
MNNDNLDFDLEDIPAIGRLERQITISEEGTDKENNRILIESTRVFLDQAEKNGLLGKKDSDKIHHEIDELTKDKYNPNLSVKIASVLGKTFFFGSLTQSCKGQEYFKDKKDEPDNSSSVAISVS